MYSTQFYAALSYTNDSNDSIQNIVTANAVRLSFSLQSGVVAAEYESGWEKYWESNRKNEKWKENNIKIEYFTNESYKNEFKTFFQTDIIFIWIAIISVTGAIFVLLGIVDVIWNNNNKFRNVKLCNIVAYIFDIIIVFFTLFSGVLISFVIVTSIGYNQLNELIVVILPFIAFINGIIMYSVIVQENCSNKLPKMVKKMKCVTIATPHNWIFIIIIVSMTTTVIFSVLTNIDGIRDFCMCTGILFVCLSSLV